MQLHFSIKKHLPLERILSLELAGVAAKGCPKSNAQKLYSGKTKQTKAEVRGA